MRERLRRLNWSGALTQLLLFGTLWLPVDAVLNRPRFGTSGLIGMGVAYSLMSLFWLPRARAGSKPERQMRWRTVVTVFVVAFVLIPLSSAVFAVLWLPRDLPYGSALLVNASVATALLAWLLVGALRGRRRGRFA